MGNNTIDVTEDITHLFDTSLYRSEIKFYTSDKLYEFVERIISVTERDLSPSVVNDLRHVKYFGISILGDTRPILIFMKEDGIIEKSLMIHDESFLKKNHDEILELLGFNAVSIIDRFDEEDVDAIRNFAKELFNE